MRLQWYPVDSKGDRHEARLPGGGLASIVKVKTETGVTRILGAIEHEDGEVEVVARGSMRFAEGFIDEDDGTPRKCWSAYSVWGEVLRRLDAHLNIN